MNHSFRFFLGVFTLIVALVTVLNAQGGGGLFYSIGQAPMLFLKNAISKRQLAIRRAFPDALDLLLICIESGMSIEAAIAIRS